MSSVFVNVDMDFLLEEDRTSLLSINNEGINIPRGRYHLGD